MLLFRTKTNYYEISHFVGLVDTALTRILYICSVF